VNRLYQKTAKRRGPTRAVEPFKKKKKSRKSPFFREREAKIEYRSECDVLM
jgi:hypothetical protein